MIASRSLADVPPEPSLKRAEPNKNQEMVKSSVDRGRKVLLVSAGS